MMDTVKCRLYFSAAYSTTGRCVPPMNGSLFSDAASRALLAELVRIPSPFFREEAIMDFTFSWLHEHGLPAEKHRYHVKPIYDFHGVNILGTLEGAEAGPRIVLNGHLDSVDLCEGWTRDPYGAEMEGNRLYGLGALDMKGGCAAILLAMKAFAKTVRRFRGSVCYTLVSDEEGPFGLGTDALIRDGLLEGADVAVVTEPSSAFAGCDFPDLGLGARGGWNYTVSLKGRAAHGANPELGINAVVEAAKVLLEIEKTPLATHEKLGPGSICPLGFSGGGAPLSVPDQASFSVFRHVIPGENKETILREVSAAIERAGLSGDVCLAFRNAPYPECDGFLPYVVDEDNPWTSAFRRSIVAVTKKEPKPTYFSSVGDFNYLGTRLGIPTLVFGPKGANYHSPDEYVEIDTVTKTAEVLYDFLVSSLGAER